MKQSIYIECYEGLSARMLTEALLDLMPEGKAARKLVAGLRKLSCSEAARQEMLHNMQERIHEFALPADAERLFARAYGIWLNAKATVEHVEPEELRFSKRDFDGVIAMMTTAIGMEQLQIGEVICPVLYEGFECITTQDGKKQVPLPETLYILMDTGIALQRMERDGAWVTPEAAALLAACKIVRHLPKQYQMISQGVGKRCIFGRRAGPPSCCAAPQKFCGQTDETGSSDTEEGGTGITDAGFGRAKIHTTQICGKGRTKIRTRIRSKCTRKSCEIRTAGS